MRLQFTLFSIHFECMLLQSRTKCPAYIPFLITLDYRVRHFLEDARAPMATKIWSVLNFKYTTAFFVHFLYFLFGSISLSVTMSISSWGFCLCCSLFVLLLHTRNSVERKWVRASLMLINNEMKICIIYISRELLSALQVFAHWSWRTLEIQWIRQ